MKLTEKYIKDLEFTNKRYKKYDSLGLSIVVYPSKTKKWHLKYKYLNKYNVKVLGNYPTISLKEARLIRDNFRLSLSKNINPNSVIKTKSINKIKNIAESLFEKLKQELNPVTYNLKIKIYNKYLSSLFEADINKLTIHDILPILKLREQQSINGSKKLKSILNQIYIHAISLGIISNNIIPNLNGLLLSEKTRGFAFLERDEDIKELLQKIEDYQCNLISVKAGLMIMPYTFVRSKELRFARWNEIDFENKLWRIPAEHMKMKRDHIVPMSKQVIKIFKDLQLINGSKKYCFDNSTGGTISDASLLQAIKRMGFNSKMTVHGFRKIASTKLHEKEYKTEAIEMQLAHQDGSIRGVYNKALYLEYRRNMMQEWADYLDNLRDS